MTTDTVPVSPATDVAATRRTLSGIGMGIGSISSVHVGATQATLLFPAAGPGGTVFLRLGLAAGILLAVTRPRLRGRHDWPVVVAFGLVLAAMNTSFYAGIARLPLGMAVAIELTGPLAVAAWGTRRTGGLRWAALAAVGAVGLVVGEVALDVFGLLFVLGAAASWAGYILLSRESGRRSSGADGLALSMIVATTAVAPLGMIDGGTALLDPRILAAGVLVGVLSSAVPYSLDLLALRRVPAPTYGVLMALNPAVAALVAWLVLGQSLAPLQLVSMALVVVAVAGAVGASTGHTSTAHRSRAPA